MGHIVSRLTVPYCNMSLALNLGKLSCGDKYSKPNRSRG